MDGARAGSPLDGRLAELTRLFHDHADGVHNVAFRILWNRADAEDVVQTAFLQAFIHLRELADRGKARPWLLRIAYREALNVLRRRREVPMDPVTIAEGARGLDADPVDAVIAADLAATIRRAIDDLPETLRVAFVLRDVEGTAMADVADILGIGASAAKMRVARAREQLRHSLQGVL